MQSCCLFAFHLQPEDTQVFVCTVPAYFYLHQIWLSLVKCESGMYSSSLPKQSMSLPVRAVGTVSRVGWCLAPARGEALSAASRRSGSALGKGRGRGSGPAAERGGGFGRVVFMPTSNALKSPRLHFPFLERRGAVFPRLTWDACPAVPLPDGGLWKEWGQRPGKSRNQENDPLGGLSLGGFPWASGGFRLS